MLKRKPQNCGCSTVQHTADRINKLFYFFHKFTQVPTSLSGNPIDMKYLQVVCDRLGKLLSLLPEPSFYQPFVCKLCYRCRLELQVILISTFQSIIFVLSDVLQYLSIYQTLVFEMDVSLLVNCFKNCFATPQHFAPEINPVTLDPNHMGKYSLLRVPCTHISL